MAAWLLATSGAAEPRQIHHRHRGAHGPVVETLIERRLRRLRPQSQADGPLSRPLLDAGAKDDSRDALVMASACGTDPHCFRRLAATDPIIVELRDGRASRRPRQ